MHVKDTKLILVTLLDLNHDGLGEAEWTGEWAPLTSIVEFLEVTFPMELKICLI